MGKSLYLLVFCTLIISISSQVWGAYLSTDWTKESVDKAVDTQGDCGWYTSLAIDGNDPRISYYYDGSLKYAYKNGVSAWFTETVDSNSNSFYLGEGTSLVLDSSGNPHISYCNAATYDLKVASYNGSSWNVQTIDSEGVVGNYSSIAIDSNDYPHVSYYDGSTGDLKYAKYNGSSWSTETVDGNDPNNDWVGLHSSLELDANDYPRISYYDSTNQSLKYAAYDGASWNIETVDSTGSFAGRDSSLALDANDNPMIAYHYADEGTPTDIRFANYNGSSWTIEALPSGVVDFSTWAVPHLDLVVGSDGKPRVSHGGVAKEKNPDGKRRQPTLKYAIKSGGVWSAEWVDGGYTDDLVNLEYKGHYNSVGVGSDGKARISYLDTSENALRYAIEN